MPPLPGNFWHCVCVCVCVCVSHSVVSKSFATPWTIAYQAPLVHGFSRKDWSGLPFPSPRYLPNPGIEPISCIGRQILYCLSHHESLVWVRIGKLNCAAWGIPGGSVVKNSPVRAEDTALTSSIPDPGRSYMLQGS